MKSNKYWSNRQAWNMYHQMDLSEQTADEIAKLYLKASRWLTLQSMEIFEKFMDKHRLTEAEARILLNTLQDKNDINRLIQILKSSASTPEKKEIIQKLEAPAYSARIERLRQLQNQLDQLMTNVYQQELAKNTAHYVDLANEAYYRTMFEIQQKAGYGFSFNHISRKQIDRVLQMNWSGKHYSKRIWKNTKALADDMKEELLLSLVTGRTDRETAQIIQNKFASGAMQARRLVRTESCFVSGELTAKAYEECGIEKYRYVATLDLRTSLVCRDLDGQEFQLSDRKVGKNYPPMHPWCRSTTIAAPTAKELAIMKRRAFDPETGKHILVPASMTYKEWYKKYVQGSEKALAQEKAVKNKASDRKQYERYKEILGKDAPNTLVQFQEMKYNEPEKWEAFNSKYEDTKLLSRIKTEYNLKIHDGKQGKHIKGHNNYQGKSYLLDNISPQKLVDKYAGTGTVRRDLNGKWINRQFFMSDKQIGVVIDSETKVETPTKYFSIEYSKVTGTHIVPRKEPVKDGHN